MPEPIRFYFDFASPYGYFASHRIEEIAHRHGRTVEWKAIMVWSLLKAHGIAPPGAVELKWSYFVHDMKRSAAFYGLPYRHPDKLPFSAHKAGRLFNTIVRQDRDRAVRLAQAIYDAAFVEGRDITATDVLIEIGTRYGLTAEATGEAVEGEEGRALLASAIDEAIEAGALGSPFFIVDGEPFFGADRLQQIEWRLAGDRDG